MKEISFGSYVILIKARVQPDASVISFIYLFVCLFMAMEQNTGQESGK